MRSHGRGRGLAVHAADDDALFAIQDRRERVRAAHHVAALAQRLVVLRVARTDRRGKNDEVGIGDVRRSLAGEKAQAEFFQPVDLHGARFVRAADGVSERNEQPGDAAHAGAGDADQVNLQFTANEDVCKNLACVH